MNLKFDFNDCGQQRHFEREDVTRWYLCRDWETFAIVLVAFIQLPNSQCEYVFKTDLDNVSNLEGDSLQDKREKLTALGLGTIVSKKSNENSLTNET